MTGELQSLISSDTDDSLDDSQIVKFVEKKNKEPVSTDRDEEEDDLDDAELLKATESFHNNSNDRQNTNTNGINFNVQTRDSLVSPTKSLQKRFSQRTLDGGIAPSASPKSSLNSTPPGSVVVVDNLYPTHHQLNHDNLKTYIYPSNLELRDYQFNIIKKALFQNILCALPTGLGKTFIASTVMLNWYRWTKNGKIIFMAPTKPLVAQQIQACLGLTGIPKEDSCVLVGNNKIKPADRGEVWDSKRVFFCTPQTVEKDLKKGLLDPKDVVCLVVDEAHRATGNYAYTQVVKLISECNKSFRILALTATPSSTVEGVQNVLTNMMISRTEIRSENSLDISKYVHKRDLRKILVEPTEEQEELLDLICQAAEPIVNELRSKNIYTVSSPRSVTQYGAVDANRRLMVSDFARANRGLASRYSALLSILIKFGYAISLLQNQGIAQFYNKLKEIKLDATHDAKGKTKTPAKNIKSFLNHEGFVKCFQKCEDLINDSTTNFIGHPKLLHLIEIMDGFFDNEQNNKSSRVIIFTDYRNSASEIFRVLKQQCNNVRPHIFVGQQNRDNTKQGKKLKKVEVEGEEEEEGEDPNHHDVELDANDTVHNTGMKQGKQQQVIDNFKTGELNTLIATSIGEEGLDIGEVDMIICYDQSTSPIRSLQRMGRTGRKRQGTIYMLMTSQEERKVEQSMDAYKYLQKIIPDTSRFEYTEGDRILPKEYNPECEYKVIEIPESNKEILNKTDDDAIVSQLEPNNSNKRKRQRKNNKPLPKKRRLPDNAEEGFVTAGELLAKEEDNEDPLEDMDSIRDRMKRKNKDKMGNNKRLNDSITEEKESGVLNELFSPSPTASQQRQDEQGPDSSPFDKDVIDLQSD